MPSTLASRFTQSSAALARMAAVSVAEYVPAPSWPNLTADREVVIADTADPRPHVFSPNLSIFRECGRCNAVEDARWHVTAAEQQRTAERVRDWWL